MDANTRFLPINLRVDATTRALDLPLLALVDAGLFDELRRLPWRTSGTGLVFRQYFDLHNSHLVSKQVTATEYLGRRVLRVSAGTPCHFVNGDRLDCRVGNLLVGKPANTAPRVAPGETLRLHADYATALRDRSEKQAAHLAQLIGKGRRGSLTPEQVKKLLADVETHRWLRGAALAAIREYVDEEFKVNISATQLSRILRGECLRVPDFNYERLSAARPSRAQLAETRERQRQILQIDPFADIENAI